MIEDFESWKARVNDFMQTECQSKESIYIDPTSVSMKDFEFDFDKVLRNAQVFEDIVEKNDDEFKSIQKMRNHLKNNNVSEEDFLSIGSIIAGIKCTRKIRYRNSNGNIVHPIRQSYLDIITSVLEKFSYYSSDKIVQNENYYLFNHMIARKLAQKLFNFNRQLKFSPEDVKKPESLASRYQENIIFSPDGHRKIRLLATNDIELHIRNKISNRIRSRIYRDKKKQEEQLRRATTNITYNNYGVINQSFNSVSESVIETVKENPTLEYEDLSEAEENKDENQIKKPNQMEPLERVESLKRKANDDLENVFKHLYPNYGNPGLEEVSDDEDNKENIFATEHKKMNVKEPLSDLRIHQKSEEEEEEQDKKYSDFKAKEKANAKAKIVAKKKKQKKY